MSLSTSRRASFALALAFLAGGCDASPEASDAGVLPDDALVAPADAPQMGDAPGLDAPLPAMDTGSDGASADAARPTGTAYTAPLAVGELTGVEETSGIVASRDYPGVFWVHNDSGNPPQIFAIDEAANLLATFDVSGATLEDWEDITLLPSAGADSIYIGDHGDNRARTSGGASSGRAVPVRVYRVEEPDPRGGATSVAAERLELAYPDGPHDCEALFADHASGDLWLVTKVDTGTAHVYVARAPLSSTGATMLEHVTMLSMASVTAADLSADGSRLVLRNYAQIRVFPVAGTGDARFVDALAATPIIPRGAGSPAEAITFSRDGYDLYTLAEGNPTTLFHLAWE